MKENSNITNKEVQEVYRWIDIVLGNKDQEDKYRNAAISGLGNVITDYLLKIGYWTKS